jgi:hypothetical protein
MYKQQNQFDLAWSQALDKTMAVVCPFASTQNSKDVMDDLLKYS